MKKFIETIFPVIREGKTRIYILCGLCVIFLIVHEKGEEEMAIITTLSALLPLATMQAIRDDYLRFAQRNDPENGKKTLPQFLLWAILNTQHGPYALCSLLIFLFLFIFAALKKLSLIA